MPDTELIGQPLRRSSAVSAPRPRRVGNDVLREASHRLGVTALVLAVLWLSAAAISHIVFRLLTRGDPRWRDLGGDDVISLASALISLALYRFTRKPGRDPQFVLDLGLVYLVVTAFAIALRLHWDRLPIAWTPAPVITMVGPIILLFAAIVPNSPWKTLVAGLIAVSMNPVSMLVARARGTWDFGPLSNVLVMHYPDYMLVGMAVVVSHVLTRLGEQVTQARELGSYRLGALLGKGGMGEVYQATHRMLARPAAIKLIRADTLAGRDGEAAAQAIRRFRREAEVAASLRSPHTVQLYDFGVTEDGTFYFVMELLDGVDLESLVQRKGPVPAGRVIYILRQVCESLEEAHSLGLVHRDIKPANIHLGRLGLRHDFVKVLDFGLVKLMRGDAGDESLASAAGLTPGTPAYMAPEVALGRDYDGRADLYGLGCVAYFLLTGQRVFDAVNGLQMIARHLHDAPVPPSRRTELPVPPALERLILECLAKNPGDRPANAAALSKALAGIETEVWGEDQAGRWWQVNRLD